MRPAPSQPVVHLELHTGDLEAARSFYAEVCGWDEEEVHCRHGSYVVVELGGGALGGGIVECSAEAPRWLPYVEVDDVCAATDRARRLGASVLLSPREGPAGWRSVVSSPVAGELAFWQPKR
jgi:predicted enzyme related to lactoylglutathione lyase